MSSDNRQPRHLLGYSPSTSAAAGCTVYSVEEQTEEKAKVGAAVWGMHLNAALAI